jgi:ABC-type sulfate transport system permease component
MPAAILLGPKRQEEVHREKAQSAVFTRFGNVRCYLGRRESKIVKMDFGNIDWFPIKLSFAVAGAATLIALVAGSALAWLLARKRFPGRHLIDSLITLPLVLPPTVLGYYLLVLLGTRSSFGGFLYHRLGIRLTFTVSAAIIAATIHALPLVTKSLREALILNLKLLPELWDLAAA